MNSVTECEMENYELGSGIYCFSPIRSKRWLVKGFKSDLCSIEEIQVQIAMALNKDNPNFENNHEQALMELEDNIKDQIKKIEKLSIMTKHVPSWVADVGRYVSCSANFQCKHTL